jgi:uncharacterized protein
MSELLNANDRAQLESAEGLGFRSPIPVQPISNGEIMVGPQTDDQRKVEFRIRELAAEFSLKQGISRRSFLRTASGMATAFLSMNEVYGQLFAVSRAEAATLDVAATRANALSSQFVFDVHTHYLRPNPKPDSSLRQMVEFRKWGRKWNPALRLKTPTYEDLSYDNFVKEMFLDSDTKLAILSGAPAEDPKEWMLTNDAIASAKARVNADAGSTRLMSHAVLSPTDWGWLDEVDRSIAVLKPDAWKFYTIGDSLRLEVARPWRLDEENLAYPGYEKFDKAGIRNVCVHKGLFPPSAEQQYPHLVVGARVDDVAKAAKDWPQLNFIIYHAGFRHVGPDVDLKIFGAEFERTGRIDWVSDLADIPARHGVKNVYSDIGGTFAVLCVDYPRLAAAVLGILIKGLGADHVTWGTDAIWFGSPQWQIEALRRIEIPEDLQKRFGFAPLGPADGPVKSGILGGNSARLYGIKTKLASAEFATDRFASLKADYQANGGERSNLAYGLVRKDARAVPT